MILCNRLDQVHRGLQRMCSRLHSFVPVPGHKDNVDAALCGDPLCYALNRGGLAVRSPLDGQVAATVWHTG